MESAFARIFGGVEVGACVKEFTGLIESGEADVGSVLNEFALKVADDVADRRPMYLAVMTGVCKEIADKVNVSDVIEGFRTVLVEAGHRTVKRARRLARVLSFAALSRAGLFKGQKEAVFSVVETLVDLAEHNSWMALAIYQVICDICQENVRHGVGVLLEKLGPLKEEVPTTPDKLYFWTRMKQIYPRMEVGEWAADVGSEAWLIRFESVLDMSASLLPRIHPVWSVVDPKILVASVPEGWVKDGKHRQLLSVVLGVCLPHLDLTEFLGVLKNTKLVEAGLSVQQNEKLRQCLEEKVAGVVTAADDNLFDVLNSLLKIKKEQKYVVNLIKSVCVGLSDEQMRSILGQLDSMGFEATYQLLRVQRYRTGMSDWSILAALFKAAGSKVKQPEHTIHLSQFLETDMLKKTESGKTWFEILSGVEFPMKDKVDDLLATTNQVLNGLNELSAVLQIDTKLNQCQNMESFVTTINALNDSKFVHWHACAKILTQKALPFLDTNTASILFAQPELLIVAVQMPTLVESVLPAFVEQIDAHPQSSWRPKEPPEIQIAASQAASIIPDVLSRCHQKSKDGLPEQIALSLFRLISDDETESLAKAHIDRVIHDENSTVGGFQVISELIKASPHLAAAVLHQLTELSPNVDRQGAQWKIRQWISDCCQCADLPPDAIAQAIFASINHEYPETASGKKKAEYACSWAWKLLKQIDRDIPRDPFAALVEKISATGSKKAATLIAQIAE